MRYVVRTTNVSSWSCRRVPAWVAGPNASRRRWWNRSPSARLPVVAAPNHAEDEHADGHARGGDHGDHSHVSIRAGERHKERLFMAFLILAVFMVVEVVAGLVTNSLALISDAGHMHTDVIGLGMALAAIQLASRGSERRHRTFGLYRLEILAALANAVLLFMVANYVLVEAIRRFGDAPEVMDVP